MSQSHRHDIDPGQPSMIDVVYDNTPGARARLEVVDDPRGDLETAELSPLAQRAGHLITALDRLSQESGANGYVKYAHTADGHQELHDRYYADYETVLFEKAGQIPRRNGEARHSFAEAYVLGLHDPNAVTAREIDVLYRGFRNHYAGAHNAAERTRYKRNLVRTVMAHVGQAAIPDTYVHVPEAPQTVSIESRAELYSPGKLTAERLRTVAKDARLGFLPDTTTELTDANKFLEVLHEQRGRRAPAVQNFLNYYGHSRHNLNGKHDVIRSKLFEFVDHVRSSTQTAGQLADLRDAVALQVQQGGRLDTLADVTKQFPDVQGVPRFIQYMDQLSIVERGVSAAPFNPMQPIRYELATHQGENKRLENPYTAHDRPEGVDEYIARRAGSMRLNSLDVKLRDAIENANRRQNAWAAILYDVGNNYKAIYDEVVAASS